MVSNYFVSWAVDTICLGFCSKFRLPWLFSYNHDMT